MIMISLSWMKMRKNEFFSEGGKVENEKRKLKRQEKRKKKGEEKEGREEKGYEKR